MRVHQPSSDRSLPAKRIRRSSRAIAAVSALLVAMLALSGCTEALETVPGVLQGTWMASGPGFDGRSMQIGERQIAFVVAGHASVHHPILGLYVESKGKEEIYSLDYVGEDGAEYRMHLRYDLVSGELRLPSRGQVVWNRIES